jgi:hypothetical protein
MKNLFLRTAAFFGLFTSTETLLGSFAKTADKLEAHARAEFAKAEAASDAAEAAYDAAEAKAEEIAEAARVAHLKALAEADEAAEAGARKAEKLDAKWANHVNESDRARAAANQIRATFGLNVEA